MTSEVLSFDALVMPINLSISLVYGYLIAFASFLSFHLVDNDTLDTSERKVSKTGEESQKAVTSCQLVVAVF